MELGYTDSGVYTVYVGPFDEPVDVYRDQETDDGGWLVSRDDLVRQKRF